MCLDWSGYGGDVLLSAMQCHTVTSDHISHVDCAKILNDDILDGMVLGDSDCEMRGKLEQKS